MINKDNLKGMLKALNFEEKDSVFSKQFSEIDAYLKVDFAKSLLIYPIDKGFVVNGEFTCNFTSAENFVVFECVHRLFTKGYKPEHVELEPKWKVGHGASGGRADILVKDNSGKSLLIIECKTEGSEFKKEWNYTLQGGGQLLTYAKQAGTTQYVCLYACDFSAGKVIPYQYIISLKDNDKLLEDLVLKKPLSFKEAKSLEVEDIYKAWKDTYNLDFATNGIFEDDILPYEIGKQKYTTADLPDFHPRDIQSKYHEFATIMRQHNVSGRENAFDKLVNLFLCKIVDETINASDLKFYWKGIAYDSAFDIVDRLQKLYQEGMQRFLGEDVVYVSNSAIENAFGFFIEDPDAAKETVKKYFKELKYYNNNDFGFIDVHNEKLFHQNSQVLIQVVKMLQDFKLKSETEHQFLGDLFEGFLDSGVKQSEGQFFTPMPIVKFILNSLPLRSLIHDSPLPPKAIDYACGAGHFLNELALQIKQIVSKQKESDITKYYKEIVGVEKEYRLSKVAKVSAFMYGQDEIQITYADALAKSKDLENSMFSILVANPPYSVKGFLQTLSEEERNSYSLIKAIDGKSLANNSSIETFFVERTKQLLKSNGVAGIILPVTILSNDSNLYISAREILIKYFDIISIVEFGSQTFGKTGTNTVTLFLRRKEENPAPADHWHYRVNSWFKNDKSDPVYNDSNYILKYCAHLGLVFEDYKTLLIGTPNKMLLETEYFTEYKQTFDNLTEIKNLLKQKTFKSKTKEEQDSELSRRFVDFLHEIEKDKLYYFVLASENKGKVLVVKCPASNAEQKQFLGYEWSNAKGNEGIKYINQTSVTVEVDDAETKEMILKLNGLHNINTPLYNPKERADGEKINFYVEQNFLGRELEITDNLKPYLTYYSLIDMLDFSRNIFNKQILTSPKKNSTIETQWETLRIRDLVTPMGGLWTGKKAPFQKVRVIRNTNFKKGGKLDLANVANIDVEEKQFVSRKLEKGDIIIEKSGGSETQAVGRVVKFDLEDGDYSYSNFTARLRPNSIKVSSDYLHIILNYIYELGFTFNFQSGSSGLKNLDLDRYLSIKIPIPSPEIQANIVKECDEIDREKVEQSKFDTLVQKRHDAIRKYL